MKVLIIGGTGFIGSPLIRQLQRKGHSFALFHRGITTAPLGKDVEHALAATSETATDRIYNVYEEPIFPSWGWAQKVALEANWKGKFVVLPAERTPKHLLLPGN